MGTPHGYPSSRKAKSNSLQSVGLPTGGFPDLLSGGCFPITSIGLAELPSPICRNPKEKRPWARQGKRGTRQFGLKSFGSYSKLKYGAPTDSPGVSWWRPGTVKSLDMDDRGSKHPDFCMTARDPCRAASAAHPCPSTAFSDNQPSCSSVRGFPSLTIAKGFQHYFPAAACCLLFSFHPVHSLFSFRPFASPASSSVWGPGRTDSFKLQLFAYSSEQGGCWAREGGIISQERSPLSNGSWTCLPLTSALISEVCLPLTFCSGVVSF